MARTYYRPSLWHCQAAPDHQSLQPPAAAGNRALSVTGVPSWRPQWPDHCIQRRHSTWCLGGSAEPLLTHLLNSVVASTNNVFFSVLVFPSDFALPTFLTSKDSDALSCKYHIDCLYLLGAMRPQDRWYKTLHIGWHALVPHDAGHLLNMNYSTTPLYAGALPTSHDIIPCEFLNSSL